MRGNKSLDVPFFLVGNLLSAIDSDSQSTFSYDLLSRVTSQSNAGTPGVPGVTLTSTFDAFGNRTRVSDNLGVAVDSIYDVRNQLVSRGWSGGGIDDARIDFTYTAREQLETIERFSQLSGGTSLSRTEQTYDSVGRQTGISHRDAVDQALLDFDYSHDLADQLTDWSINGVNTRFQYDSSGQLTDADRASGPVADEAFSYDLNGNRVSGSNTIGSGNRLLSDGTFDYTYDAEGNLTTKTERATGIEHRYQYDHENRLVRGTIVSGLGDVLTEVEYRYDALGRRIARTADTDGDGPLPAETETFVYDGPDVWLDGDASGNVTARYLFGDAIDEIYIRWTPADGTAWYLTDHLGTVHGIVDNVGAMATQISYDSFGQVVSISDPSVTDRYLYTGREFDADLGLYYYRARMYDAAVGRFTTEDPIGFAAGDTNLQRYVGNSPTTAIDPDGLTTTESATLKSRITGGIVVGLAYLGLVVRCVFKDVGLSLITLQGVDAGGVAQSTVSCAINPGRGGNKPPRNNRNNNGGGKNSGGDNTSGSGGSANGGGSNSGGGSSNSGGGNNNSGGGNNNNNNSNGPDRGNGGPDNNGGNNKNTGDKDGPTSGSQGNKGNGSKKAIDNLIDGATAGNSRKTRQFTKPGNVDTANKAFDNAVGNAPIKNHGGGIRSSSLPDGSTISVRPGSRQGSPTVQINPPSGKPIKIRFN